jgi:hypothetical protein
VTIAPGKPELASVTLPRISPAHAKSGVQIDSNSNIAVRERRRRKTSLRSAHSFERVLCRTECIRTDLATHSRHHLSTRQIERDPGRVCDAIQLIEIRDGGCCLMPAGITQLLSDPISASREALLVFTHHGVCVFQQQRAMGYAAFDARIGRGARIVGVSVVFAARTEQPGVTRGSVKTLIHR